MALIEEVVQRGGQSIKMMSKFSWKIGSCSACRNTQRKSVAPGFRSQSAFERSSTFGKFSLPDNTRRFDSCVATVLENASVAISAAEFFKISSTPTFRLSKRSAGKQSPASDA